jgi:hypothetical protein
MHIVYSTFQLKGPQERKSSFKVRSSCSTGESTRKPYCWISPHRQLEENVLLFFQVVWCDGSFASIAQLSEEMSQKCIDMIPMLAAPKSSCVVKQAKELFVWVRSYTLPIQ